MYPSTGVCGDMPIQSANFNPKGAVLDSSFGFWLVMMHCTGLFSDGGQSKFTSEGNVTAVAKRVLVARARFTAATVFINMK